ncbi:hypothetical protein COCSADRAFT_336427 [Bipolaris sorokiniana ND90Pr]|uniref:Uncharacterized protein n=1 Tax=Cochliobolus sativus (strain ND90Pr / ATCC 201652) TaxID=665912 RepID=M2SL50_COCSN|nr:uncharacterized protein COCSADRAFT_336427 [Bipolaris sorokiniana ND90Pr]EMD63005.1 hypothetical protein COCSADRAFT_336427 [Bipolaris sorokiniana ND90Pr]
MYLSCIGIDVVGGRSGESTGLVALPDALSVDDSSLRSSWYPSAMGYTASKRAIRHGSRDSIVAMTLVIVAALQFQRRNAVLAFSSATAINGIPHHSLFCITHLSSTHESLLLSQSPAIHLILKPYTAPASSSPPHPSSQAQTQSPTPRPPRPSPPSRSAPR